MGTWGSKILEDDTTRDVYDSYIDGFDAGKKDDDILASLSQEYSHLMDDADEGSLFWLAVTQAQWECGHLKQSTIEQVERMVEAELGLERWAEAGPKELKERKAALAKFVEQIKTPATKIRKPHPKEEVPIQVGDCLAIEFEDGNFGAAIVTRRESSKSTTYHILSILNYCEPKCPTKETFVKPRWLYVADLFPGQIPAGQGPIIKYCVYLDGFKRSAKHYQIVVNALPASIPEPLTLMVANWGNLWKRLPEKLGSKSSQ